MPSSSFPYLCRTTLKQLLLSFGAQAITDTCIISNFYLGGYSHFRITVFHQNMEVFQLTLNVLIT